MSECTGDLDEALSAVIEHHMPGRLLSEWMLVTVTQSHEDGAGASGYGLHTRPGMLHHHIRGLVDIAQDCTALDYLGDDEDE